MTDFVGRLLGRSLGALPVVEPRVRSRFENELESDRAVVESALELEAPNEPATRASARFAPRMEPVPAPGRESRSAGARSSRSTLASTSPELDTAAAPAHPFVPDSDGPASASAAQPQMSASSIVPALRARDAAPAAPDAGEPPVFARPLPSPLVAPSHAAVPRDGATRRARTPLDARGPEQPDATTVHVTIGRIEVRTASKPTPSPVPRRTQPAEAVLTLDEYLKQRKDGQR